MCVDPVCVGWSGLGEWRQGSACEQKREDAYLSRQPCARLRAPRLPRQTRQLTEAWRSENGSSMMVSASASSCSSLSIASGMISSGPIRPMESRAKRMVPTAEANWLMRAWVRICLLYTSDAADERSSVDLGG